MLPEGFEHFSQLFYFLIENLEGFVVGVCGRVVVLNNAIVSFTSMATVPSFCIFIRVVFCKSGEGEAGICFCVQKPESRLRERFISADLAVLNLHQLIVCSVRETLALPMSLLSLIFRLLLAHEVRLLRTSLEIAIALLEVSISWWDWVNSLFERKIASFDFRMTFSDRNTAAATRPSN